MDLSSGARDSARDTDGPMDRNPEANNKKRRHDHPCVRECPGDEEGGKREHDGGDEQAIDGPCLRESATDDASNKHPAGHGGEAGGSSSGTQPCSLAQEVRAPQRQGEFGCQEKTDDAQRPPETSGHR